MTTKSEEERLGIVETQIATLQTDVTEIKADVKSLVAAQAAFTLALARREAAELAVGNARASTGTWVRAAVPWLLTGVGLAIAAASLLFRTLGV
jgi:hypothetical protein